MKISGSQVGQVSPVQIGKIKKTEPTSKTESVQKSDRVILSEDYGAIEAARKVIAETPDIREDKVAELRKSIAEGTYKVSSNDIADRIIAELRMSKQS